MDSELRLKVNSDYLDRLKELSGESKSNQMIADALVVYEWALENSANGFDIVTQKDGAEKVQKVVSAGLRHASTLKKKY